MNYNFFEMKNIYRWIFLFFMFILLSGCAHVISKDLRTQVDISLTFQQVLQNPNAYKGKMVVWGGEIIEAVNQKDGTTLIEVLQRPLGWREEPRKTIASEGRFLALVDRYLDPYVFRKGRKVTVAGEILGEEIKQIGKMDYRYPLLSSRQIYLWEDYYYYPVPYYYDPWWDYPYGWRGYPYGWGPPYWWRFNFHHHRH
jgi:outer membrane lipoprotein